MSIAIEFCFAIIEDFVSWLTEEPLPGVAAKTQSDTPPVLEP